MKHIRLSVLLSLTLLQVLFAQAQDSAAAPHEGPYRIAVFAPLYLDSAFDASGNYRYDKTTWPRFINPGLEFWEGAQLAIDSMKKEGLQLDIHVYDTRSAASKIETVMVSEEIKNMNLLIGHVSLNETVLLAHLAANLSIPFINANLPNDAGITNNPDFVILNSTLSTHCTAIYKYLQKNFALSNIIIFRKKGVTEDRLQEYFVEAGKTTTGVPLKVKYVTLENNFTIKQLQAYIDSNITNVCLVSSLDAAFGQAICQQLASVSSSYASTVFGMPTWDVVDFEKPVYKGVEIYYSTPFYADPANKLVVSMQDYFKNAMFAIPSDMVYRGYETLYRFGHLLNDHGKNLSSSIGDKKYKVFNDFDIQPVLNRKTMTLDYFENKKLHFIRKIDGVVKAVY
ncbi:MAG: hypothetical protein QM731_13060 [Chitinophagaceae bacterium]